MLAFIALAIFACSSNEEELISGDDQLKEAPSTPTTNDKTACGDSSASVESGNLPSGKSAQVDVPLSYEGVGRVLMWPGFDARGEVTFVFNGKEYSTSTASTEMRFKGKPGKQVRVEIRNNTHRNVPWETQRLASECRSAESIWCTDRTDDRTSESPDAGPSFIPLPADIRPRDSNCFDASAD